MPLGRYNTGSRRRPTQSTAVGAGSRRVARRRDTERADLHAALREIVLCRDGYRCVKCNAPKRPGRAGGLQAAHIFPDGAYPALRYLPANVITLCGRCHIFGWHKDVLRQRAWLVEKYGSAFVEQLEFLARSKREAPDRSAVRLMLALQLRELGLVDRWNLLGGNR